MGTDPNTIGSLRKQLRRTLAALDEAFMFLEGEGDLTRRQVLRKVNGARYAAEATLSAKPPTGRRPKTDPRPRCPCGALLTQVGSIGIVDYEGRWDAQATRSVCDKGHMIFVADADAISKAEEEAAGEALPAAAATDSPPYLALVCANGDIDATPAGSYDAALAYLRRRAADMRWDEEHRAYAPDDDVPYARLTVEQLSELYADGNPDSWVRIVQVNSVNPWPAPPATPPEHPFVQALLALEQRLAATSTYDPDLTSHFDPSEQAVSGRSEGDWLAQHLVSVLWKHYLAGGDMEVSVAAELRLAQARVQTVADAIDQIDPPDPEETLCFTALFDAIDAITGSRFGPSYQGSAEPDTALDRAILAELEETLVEEAPCLLQLDTAKTVIERLAGELGDVIRALQP